MEEPPYFHSKDSNESNLFEFAISLRFLCQRFLVCINPESALETIHVMNTLYTCYSIEPDMTKTIDIFLVAYILTLTKGIIAISKDLNTCQNGIREILETFEKECSQAANYNLSTYETADSDIELHFSSNKEDMSFYKEDPELTMIQQEESIPLAMDEHTINEDTDTRLSFDTDLTVLVDEKEEELEEKEEDLEDKGIDQDSFNDPSSSSDESFGLPNISQRRQQRGVPQIAVESRESSPALKPNTRQNYAFGVKKTLMSWLQSHKTNPFPTPDEKLELIECTGLSMIQINNWFINARRRYIPSVKKRQE